MDRKSDGHGAACKIIAKPKSDKEMATVEMECASADASTRGAPDILTQRLVDRISSPPQTTS